MHDTSDEVEAIVSRLFWWNLRKELSLYDDVSVYGRSRRILAQGEGYWLEVRYSYTWRDRLRREKFGGHKLSQRA